MKKLTKNVYYIPHKSDTDRPVIGVVNGTKHSLMIDAGNSPHHAREILEAIEHSGINNVKYLALTHWHWDHVFGTHYMNLTTICHELTQEKLQWMKELEWDDQALDARVAAGKEIQFCSSMIKKEMPSREGLILKEGDITFDSRVEISLGGINCIIENVGGDHGADCSIVYISSDKVMFLGDCLGPDFYSGPHSYSGRVADMISKISKYDVDIYISAHDEPLDKEEVHSYFKELLEMEELTGGITDEAKAALTFTKAYGRNPSEDELITMKCFIEGNIKELCKNR